MQSDLSTTLGPIADGAACRATVLQWAKTMTEFNRAYDKAKWHFEAVEEIDETLRNAYAPTSYFVAWAASEGLLNDEHAAGLADLVEGFRRREVDGIQIWERLDGVISRDDMSPIGRRFADWYLGHKSGRYLRDLHEELPLDVLDEYHLGWRCGEYPRAVSPRGRLPPPVFRDGGALQEVAVTGLECGLARVRGSGHPPHCPCARPDAPKARSLRVSAAFPRQ